MMSNFQLLFNVGVFVLKDLSFFYQPFRLYFVLFFIDLLIDSILLQSKDLQARTNHIEIILFHFSLLFEL